MNAQGTRIKVKWLGNHWLRIETATGSGRVFRRTVKPADCVTVREAAAALETYPVEIYRMLKAGKLRPVRIAGTMKLRVRTLMRLRRERSEARNAA